MIRAALRGLQGRKFRALLTALAIVLGVAMVSGTYVLTDTIQAAFDKVFNQSYAETSAVVSGRSADISFQGNEAAAPPVPAALLPRIRKLPDVEAAAGQIVQLGTKILDKHGKVVDTNGAPAFGFGVDFRQDRFNPLNLVEGTWPTDPREAVIDAGTADAEGFHSGDEVGIAPPTGGLRRFRLSGIAQYGGVNSLGTATFAVMTLPAAQQLFDKEGEFDAISVAAKPGVSQELITREIRPLLPPNVQVRTGKAEAAKQSETGDQITRFVRYFLLAFAGIAVFVGAFVIFNTLSITVAQRMREFATMRTIGASRRQVLGTVVVEAAVIGVIASLAGLALGYGLAHALNALFKALNLDLPTTGMIFATRTVVVGLTVGVVVTLLAGLAPAIRATKVPPIAAVREGATLPRSRLAPYVPLIAAITIAIALALLGYAMFKNQLATVNRLLSIAAGVLLLFTGVAMLADRAVKPLARPLAPVAETLVILLKLVWAALLTLVPYYPLSWALRRLGLRWRILRPYPRLVPEEITRELAGENARRNPGRTAATAAALMIGLALVTFVAVFGQGLRSSNRQAIEDQVISEYVVTSQSGFEPFPAAAGTAVTKTPGIEFATQIRSDLAKASGDSGYVTGIDPRTISRGYHFDWVGGTDAALARLGRSGAIVDKDFAESKSLEIGDVFQLVTPRREKVWLVVRAIYRPPPFFPLLGKVSISRRLFDTLFTPIRDQYVFVNVRGEPSPAEQKALERSLARYPDALVQTREEWIKQQDEDATQFLNFLYILLALSVIVSLFGMVNTLVLSVFERTRELGMLRAIGMTQPQARRMVRNESVVTALIGATLGLPLGIFLALLVNRALSEFDVAFVIPIRQLVAFGIVAVLAGILAAIIPARRAARLRVLEALHYE